MKNTTIDAEDGYIPFELIQKQTISLLLTTKEKKSEMSSSIDSREL